MFYCFTKEKKGKIEPNFSILTTRWALRSYIQKRKKGLVELHDIHVLSKKRKKEISKSHGGVPKNVLVICWVLIGRCCFLSFSPVVVWQWEREPSIGPPEPTGFFTSLFRPPFNSPAVSWAARRASTGRAQRKRKKGQTAQKIRAVCYLIG